MIRIMLIRHGRTAWNVEQGVANGKGKRFRGIVDLPLAEDGLLQAQATARRLAAIPLQAIYSSPLQRAVHTAEIIAEPHGLAVQALPGLVSQNYGAWTGLLDSDVARQWPTLYHQWRRDPFSIQVPGGESTADLRDRATAALQDVLSRHASGDTIALVSHQVVTRTLAWVLTVMHPQHATTSAYWRFQQDLCNLTCFDYDPLSKQFTLVTLNDTCHLGSDLPRDVGGSTRIFLIRHGQTAWNAVSRTSTLVERFRGRTDLPLDDTGLAQARAVAQRLESETISAVYSSPLLRTQQTIRPLADKLILPVRPHQGLIDLDYGRFQGLTHSDAAVLHPETYLLWQTAPSQVRFPDGESLAEVQIRLLALLKELAGRHPDQTIALTGHQIVNKVLVCTLLGLNLDQIWRIQQDTCSIDVFQLESDGWHTLRLNDVCHLK
jgi:broad specificity phosphatase PhoE